LTYDLNAGALAPFGPQTWFVSLSGGEQRLPAAPRFDDLVDWVSLHQGLLLQPSHYIGLWPDRRREVHVLDVTVPVDGRERAIRVGNQQGQEVIYHPASGEELALG